MRSLQWITLDSSRTTITAQTGPSRGPAGAGHVINQQTYNIFIIISKKNILLEENRIFHRMKRFWMWLARKIKQGTWDINDQNKPKHILLIRHGQSEGNVDERLFGVKPDHDMLLTDLGRLQSREIGRTIKDQFIKDGSVRVIVSPYARTKGTLAEIMKELDPKSVVVVEEDPRVREQDFGNFQNSEEMNKSKQLRRDYGSFHFRFPNGESGADVYDRAHGFLDSLNRRWENQRDEDNLIIVSHGLFCRLFLMRYFKWNISVFESIPNLNNGQCIALRLDGHKYTILNPLPNMPTSANTNANNTNNDSKCIGL